VGARVAELRHRLAGAAAVCAAACLALIGRCADGRPAAAVAELHALRELDALAVDALLVVLAAVEAAASASGGRPRGARAAAGVLRIAARAAQLTRALQIRGARRAVGQRAGDAGARGKTAAQQGAAIKRAPRLCAVEQGIDGAQAARRKLDVGAAIGN